MADLIWLNEDALRRTHPVFAAGGSGAPAVYVWERAYFEACHIGPKRQLFIYETLAELGVEFFEGKPETILPRLVAAREISRILVPASPNPEIMRRVGGLRRAIPEVTIETVEDTPFVTPSREPDLGRFFRYWNKVRKSAMRPNGI